MGVTDKCSLTIANFLVFHLCSQEATQRSWSIDLYRIDAWLGGWWISELGYNTLIYVRCRLWGIFKMHCPERSTNESLPLCLLVPGSSLSHGSMEEFQDFWQGRGRPWQVPWLQLSLTLCMFEPLALWQCIYSFLVLHTSQNLWLSTCSAIQLCHLQSSSVASCFLFSLSLNKTILILYAYYFYRE